GADVMRWTFVTHQPYDNLLMGYKTTDETRRRFHIILWNVYNFYITYANLHPSQGPESVLDHWIIARLNKTISQITTSLDAYDPFTSSHALENLLSDISLWYVRRSRNRPDCLPTLHTLLVTFVQLLAPFNPFISESIYRNLTGQESVHLSDWPKAKKLSKEDLQLIEDMKLVRKIVELGLSQRKTAGVKVRQPLRLATVTSLSLSDDLTQLIKDELNIKNIKWEKGDELSVVLGLNLDSELIAEGQMREIARQVKGKCVKSPVRFRIYEN
ncbi:MAG: Isoleucyl-tRNA synthetase, partial [Candidatus Wolfebacteria bacterium GW2011_GWB1_41_12]